MIAYLFFFHMVHWSFILGQGWLLSNYFCKACQNYSSKVCHSTQSSADALIVSLLWKLPPMPSCSTNNANLDKPILTCFTKLIAVQPSMAEYEWTLYQIKVDQLCYHALKSVLLCTCILLQFWEIWGQTWVSFYATQSSYLLKTWGKSDFDMFYKNYCWAVICYPIYMTNVSYERRIIVLSFPDISFVILLFIFQRFEIKSGCPFFNSHCILIFQNIVINEFRNWMF